MEDAPIIIPARVLLSHMIATILAARLCQLFSEFKAFKTVDFLKFFARTSKFRKYEKVKIGTFLWPFFDGFCM